MTTPATTDCPQITYEKLIKWNGDCWLHYHPTYFSFVDPSDLRKLYLDGWVTALSMPGHPIRKSTVVEERIKYIKSAQTSIQQSGLTLPVTNISLSDLAFMSPNCKVDLAFVLRAHSSDTIDIMRAAHKWDIHFKRFPFHEVHMFIIYYNFTISQRIACHLILLLFVHLGSP